MKKYVSSAKQIALTFFAGLLLVACTQEESESIPLDSEAEIITVAELKSSDETEYIAEEVTAIAEDSYAQDEMSALSKLNYTSNYLPDCVIVTTVVTDTSKERTLDFGEGCELPNGNVVAGIMILSYQKDMTLAQNNIMLSLQNFTFNGVAVEGGSSIVRVRSNENGNPQGVATVNFSGTWPNGDKASLDGTRTREWVEGYGSGFWGDNVFLITGKRTIVGKQGSVFDREVVSPLRREASCRFIVSGVLNITRNGNMASLDFGGGSCDAKGILTLPNGEIQEVFLRRFLNK